MANPSFVLTAGEPAGIGPDLIVQLAQQLATLPHLTVVASRQLLEERALKLNRPIAWINALNVRDVPLQGPCIPGQLNIKNAAYVLETLEVATNQCLACNKAILLTAPVHKGIINEAGIPFTGHTEFLAQLTQTKKVVMMLACDALRVALATTHVPLAEVSTLLATHDLIERLTILYEGLRTHFQIAKPHIAVCGLNPHAGEQGYLGKEEITVIQPAIDHLLQQGLKVSGPFPADTLFTRANEFDAIMAMYHDQGLPVVKYAGFGHVVNITLGLPFIRTSVDHGTALSLAGTGKSQVTSLQAAISMAMQHASTA